MSEILIAFLILFTAVIMAVLIILIVQFDKKITKLEKKVAEIGEIDFSNLRKFVKIVNRINAHVHLGRIKEVISAVLTAISAMQLVMFYKKLLTRLKESK